MRAGVDVIGIERFGRSLERSPGLLDRVFTAGERADATRDGVAVSAAVAVARLAARFAAKEATMKALGTRLAWHEVEITTDHTGAPHLLVRGEPAGISVSLSHDAGVAVAFVVAPGGPAAAPPGSEEVPVVTAAPGAGAMTRSAEREAS